MFVGRARELDLVAVDTARVRTGVLRVVHLSGEAGVGKTAVAEQIVARAGGMWTTGWGRAWNNPVAPPYWIWTQILAAVERSTAAASRMDSMSRYWLREIAPALPPVDAPIADTVPRQARAGLLRAFVTYLRAGMRSSSPSC